MEHTPKTVVVEGERRRRRPAISCALCRKRKLRCNRQRPCSNCIRSKAETCVYESHGSGPHATTQSPIGVFFLDADAPRSAPASAPAPAQSMSNSSPNESLSTRNHTSNLATRNLISPLTPGSQDESITNRSVLEAGKVWSSVHEFCSTQPTSSSSQPRLSPQQQPQPQPQPQQQQSQSPYDNSETDFLKQARHITGGELHFHRDHHLPNSTEPALIRSVTHKTRFFGQSHWINVFQVFKNMFVLNDVHLLEEKSNTYPLLLKCKSLAKIIKAKRNPSWPTVPTRDLPDRQVCDKLIDCYLKTTENMHRILHLPSFKRDYEELWEPGAFPDIAFIVHLKLVLALGTVCYDEDFSMRSSAVRWVYEAQTWISEPEFKARLGIQFIQTHILLLLARESVGVAGDSVWVSAGELVRRAMHMGLHRDPHHLPRRSLYATQMHRRLWNTILEIMLKMSLSSGGPPLISLDDFDTEPPGNFDDEQLMTEGSVEKPESEYTNMSISLALRNTLPARLAVTAFLNELTSCGTYGRTLELDAELRSAYKILVHTLRGFKFKQATGQVKSEPSELDLRFIDFIMQRHISALHTPYFIPALRQTKYALSRRLAIEATLKIWAAAYPYSAIMSHRHSQDPPPSSSTSPLSSRLGNEDLLTRLSYTGPGFYRNTAMQASLLITAELDTQLREDQGLVPLPLRVDLVSVIREAEDYSLRCIKSGETNVKGYLVTCVITSHIEALMRGVDPSEIPPLFRKASEEAMERCVRILEEQAGESQDVGAVNEEEDMGIGMRQQSPDWDFLISDAMFAYNTGLNEPMNWFVSDGTR